MRYCKGFAKLLLWVILERLIMPIVSPCLLTKVLKQTYRKLWFWSACKKSTSFITSLRRYCKGIANLLFWELWERLTVHFKIILLICNKHSFLSTCKKSTSSLTTKIILSIWRNYSCLSACKKSTSSFMLVFLEILQRYCKPVVLGTLSMLGYAHSKW